MDLKIFLDLNELKLDNFYITINLGFNSEIIKSLLNKYSSGKIVSTKFGFSLVSFYRWKKNGQYPFRYLIMILKDLNLDLITLSQNLISLKSGFRNSGGGGISNPIFPHFPIYMSEQLANIISHILCDGCLSINQKSEINLAYYNQSKTLRENFKTDIKEIFGDIHFGEGINKTTNFVRLPTPIGLILLTKIKTFNSKDCQIPQLIWESNQSVKISFLRTIFDDESYPCFRGSHRYIELTLCNKIFLQEIKKLLIEFNIQTTKVYYKIKDGKEGYTFYVKHFHNLALFNEKIGFTHPGKIEKMNKILTNPGRKHYSSGESQSKILSYLALKDSTSFELMLVLDRKESTINYWLNILMKENKIYKKVDSGRSIWSLKSQILANL